MNKARALSSLVSGYTAVWFALDGFWFLQWHAATIVLSIVLVSAALASFFFMRRTRHTILLSAAEFSWILFNVFWIRSDLGGVRWCQPVALGFFTCGSLCLVAAFFLKTFSKVQPPFDSLIFRRLKL